VNALRIMRYALLSGARDYAAIFTWKTWLGGWFLRVLAQVTFFAFLGRLLHSQDRTWFILIGNATMLGAMEGVYAINMVNFERGYGTLPLLVASPTNPVLVLASRGMYMIADGALSAIAALLVLGSLLRLPLTWDRVLFIVPLMVLIGASSYCFGTFLGGILLGFGRIQAVVTNIALVLLMTLCGVNVPLDAYPKPVTWVSDVLPLTHGLLAIRNGLMGRFGAAAAPALLEIVIGAGWLMACIATFRLFVRRGRSRGTLDFSV
jgi:ABC-2 type transport system permease protein